MKGISSLGSPQAIENIRHSATFPPCDIKGAANSPTSATSGPRRINRHKLGRYGYMAVRTLTKIGEAIKSVPMTCPLSRDWSSETEERAEKIVELGEAWQRLLLRQCWQNDLTKVMRWQSEDGTETSDDINDRLYFA